MTGLPAFLHFTNFKMFLALFLFLKGLAAQESQAVLVEKLDKLLAGKEKQRTLEFALTLANNDISWYQDVISKIAESYQNLVAGLERIILEVQSVEWIIQAATGFNKTLKQLQNDIQTLTGKQAAAAALQVSQFLLVIIYLLVIGIRY